MSQIAIALIVKFVMTFVIALLAFTVLVNNPWTWVLALAVIATAVNYVGDLVVLPKFGNVVTSVGDGIMRALLAFFISLATPLFVVTWTSLLLFAVLIAAGEYFFHQYLVH